MTEARRGLRYQSLLSQKSQKFHQSFQDLQGAIEKVSLFFNLGCIYRIYLKDLKRQGKGKAV